MNKFFFARKTFVALILAQAFAFSVFAQEEQPNSLAHLTVSISTMPYSMNPHEGTYHTESQIQTALYEGLFAYAPDASEPQNALATSYRISRDKLRWTFTLRENAMWSDDTKITASDVKEAWLDLIGTENAPYSSMLDVISGAKEYRTKTGAREDVAIFATDEKTLSVKLTEPVGHLPHILCHNSTAVVKKDLSVYSGPFVLDEITGDSITLLKNDKYWDAKNIKLEKISILQVEDEKEASHLFNTGDVDWIIENSDVSTVLNKNSVQINAEFATLYLFFKNKGGAASNALFRSALLEAVPWDEIRKDFMIPATTLVYPLPGYPTVTGYSYTDTTEAAALMQQARSEMGVSHDEKITLTLAIGDNMDYMRTITTLLNSAWKPLGVEVAPLTIHGDYFAAIPDVNADIFMYNWIGDFGDPTAFLDLFRGNSALNLSEWKNEKFDSLLFEAAHAETAERYKLLATAEQLLIDSAEIIPISHMVSVNVIDTSSVGGWTSNALNIHPFKFMFKRKVSQNLPGII